MDLNTDLERDPRGGTGTKRPPGSLLGSPAANA